MGRSAVPLLKFLYLLLYASSATSCIYHWSHLIGTNETGFSDYDDLELSVEGREEVKTVEEFIMKGCGCRYGPKNMVLFIFEERNN